MKKGLIFIALFVAVVLMISGCVNLEGPLEPQSNRPSNVGEADCSISCTSTTPGCSCYAEGCDPTGPRQCSAWNCMPVQQNNPNCVGACSGGCTTTPQSAVSNP